MLRLSPLHAHNFSRSSSQVSVVLASLVSRHLVLLSSQPLLGNFGDYNDLFDRSTTPDFLPYFPNDTSRVSLTPTHHTVKLGKPPSLIPQNITFNTVSDYVTQVNYSVSSSFHAKVAPPLAPTSWLPLQKTATPPSNPSDSTSAPPSIPPYPHAPRSPSLPTKPFEAQSCDGAPVPSTK
ncbi:uncharacterized protein BJ212DRAFT_1478937 [Suillus subaureus]|uniref:Uncharacterized protein n=1 Tax=Suillus subaureus TaxID=48587 RepID=A0A9P7EFI2_9AGAM|nr:uncharacterized protein BJ212DRAFT_1478937 [Suillus subaureus]KAG1819703.1 hypothetical protein BJ212DRAFT_1478937 [Suillus subaureus]